MQLLELRAVGFLWLSLLVWCRGEELILKVSGSDVTFKAETSDNATEINWFKDGNKMVDLVEGEEPEIFRLKDRVTASLSEKTLTLKNVSLADGGFYKAELVVQGRVFPYSFLLRVYDPVCKVIITNTIQENNVTLQCACFGLGDRPTNYEWFSGDSRNQVSASSQHVVSKTKEPQLFICVARNEFSEEKANFTVPTLVPESTGLSSGVVAAIVIFSLIIVTGALVYRFHERICAWWRGPCSTADPSAEGKNGNVTEKLNKNAESTYDEVPDMQESETEQNRLEPL